jgi:nitroreductase
MDAIEALITRRSIRKFSGKPVPDAVVEKILEAAMQAPSAMNQQPWHFVVVRDRELLNKIPSVSPYAAMAASAQLAIVVCADLALEKSKGFWALDCSNAAFSILLAAHASGLGAVWTAVYPREDRMEGVRRLFSIPDGVVPLVLIPIGYPAEIKPVESRFRQDRIHLERW